MNHDDKVVAALFNGWAVYLSEVCNATLPVGQRNAMQHGSRYCKVLRRVRKKWSCTS